MKLDMTIRQKLVRVVSSAAICGLSFSFIIGEAVDAKAKQITHWASDPSLLPEKFLPLAPSQTVLSSITLDRIQDRFAALNKAGAATEIVATKENKEVFKDSLRTILSAPLPDLVAGIPGPTGFTSPKAKASAAVTQVEEKMAKAEVEQLLLSVHDTAKLLGTASKKPMEDSGRVTTYTVTQKGAPQPEPLITPKPKEKIVTKSQDEFILADGPSPMPVPKPEPRLLASTELILGESDWNIRGKVVPSGKLEAGHFEVSLFSKIDQEGIPIGYPIVQQILPAGKTEFELRVPPKVERGFLYGEFVATKGGKRTWIAPHVNPWQKNDRQFAELIMNAEDSVSTVAAASAYVVSERKETVLIKGIVQTHFASKPIPQSDVVVKIRGRKESARTDPSGAFRLEIPRVAGTVYLEFLKSGYHPTLMEVPASEDGQVISVSLASRDAIDQVARRLGVRQISSKGVFFGRLMGSDGQPIKGGTVQTSLKADGPYYFDENGLASGDLRLTSADGRFIFFNLEPGSGFVDTNVGGEAIAPFVLSSVEGGELINKVLTPESGSLRGRLFNPVSGRQNLMPVTGARLRIEGASEWSNTDSYGAFSLGPMKWMKGERVSIEFSAAHYNNHRYLTIPGKKKEPLNLYAFPANYLHRLGMAMDIDIDPYSGIVMGKVSNLSVRVDAMADHASVNTARDYYFDKSGKLRGSHSMTDPGYGTYVIFNVPKGRTLLQGSDGNGVLRYSESVVSSPASISIIMD